MWNTRLRVMPSRDQLRAVAPVMSTPLALAMLLTALTDGVRAGTLPPPCSYPCASGCPAVPDCDGNGVRDACELSHCPPGDCNQNGVPDNCDVADGVPLGCGDYERYFYDALGRRIARIRRHCDGTHEETHYYYDRHQTIVETDADDAPLRYFVHGTQHVDEHILMNDVNSTQEFYYLERELHTPAGLANPDGYVTEAYTYAAYGAAQVARLNPFWPVFAESIDGNPYFFTGQRRDVVEDTGRAGIKELYDYRYRTYDSQHGRFLQRDPIARASGYHHPSHLRVDDLDGAPPGFDYVDSMNLYEYVHSQPPVKGDPYGLWGPDVHYRRTYGWARLPTVRMKARPAEIVARACNHVDPQTYWGWLNNLSLEQLSWHFDIPGETRLFWGISDSRYRHATRTRELAVELCTRKSSPPGHHWAAAYVLGMGLHPLQDWVAHGTWDPLDLLGGPNWRMHPPRTDDWGTDWVPPRWSRWRWVRDGILRNAPTPNIETWLMYGSWFVFGTKRASLTRSRTLSHINEFRDQLIPGSECYCELFDWN